MHLNFLNTLASTYIEGRRCPRFQNLLIKVCKFVLKRIMAFFYFFDSSVQKKVYFKCRVPKESFLYGI